MIIESKRAERKQNKFLAREYIALSYQQVHIVCMYCDVRVCCGCGTLFLDGYIFILPPSISQFSSFPAPSLDDNVRRPSSPPDISIQQLLSRRTKGSLMIELKNSTTSNLRWNFLSLPITNTRLSLYTNVVQHNK